MRKEFSQSVQEYCTNNNDSVFITGDLGYNALENLQLIMGSRFINAGVAEQNLIGLSAGIAFTGKQIFVYSIAPFIVFRCLEQIKIDICLHNLPVCIVGNGGGYGYGIMGATHHAIEDLACLSPLPNMTCYIPAFKEDIQYCIDQITTKRQPSYLRLGLGISYPNMLSISNFNHIIKCNNVKLTIISLGPIINNVLEAIKEISDVDLFTLISFPFSEISDELKESLEKSKNLLVIEEHVKRGGVSEYLLTKLFNLNLKKFTSLNAVGYPTGTYGSQAFHQKESGLGVENIRSTILNLK